METNNHTVESVLSYLVASVIRIEETVQALEFQVSGLNRNGSKLEKSLFKQLISGMARRERTEAQLESAREQFAEWSTLISEHYQIKTETFFRCLADQAVEAALENQKKGKKP